MLLPGLRDPFGLPFVPLLGPLDVLLVQAGALIVGVTYAMVTFVAGQAGVHVHLEGQRVSEFEGPASGQGCSPGALGGQKVSTEKGSRGVVRDSNEKTR